MRLSSLLVLAVALPVVVIGLAPYPLLIFLVLSLLGGWSLYRSQSTQHWVWLFGLAAVFGTLGEYYCVYGAWTTFGDGLWNYHFPSSFNLELPVWIPLIWGNLFVFFAGVSFLITPDYSRPASRWWIQLVRFLAIFLILAYAGVMYRSIKFEILYALTPLLALMVTFWTHIRDLAIYFIAAIGGSIGEILAMRWELWSYTVPMFENWITEWLGVPGLPVSLGMAWGMSALFLNRLALLLHDVDWTITCKIDKLTEEY